MLIDFSRWQEAVEEVFNGKKFEYLDDIKSKAPAFVNDFIRDEQIRRGNK